MNGKMKALIMEAKEKYRVTKVPVPKPEKEEVLIKVDSCGLCGTDVHIYRGKFFANLPLIIGHEISGTVVKTGQNVKIIKEGDKVVVNPNMNCKLCYFCRKGKVHLCENLVNIGVRIDGGFAEYISVKESYVYRLSDRIDLEEASFAEPLSCCIHGVEMAEIESADQVVILGAGPVGLLMLQIIKLMATSRVVVIDPVKKRRELAENLGADWTVNPLESNILDRLLEFLGKPPDVVFECVGRKQTMEQSWKMVNSGGKVVWFGVADPEEDIRINPYQIYRKEITISGSFVNPFTTGKAVSLLESGKIKVKELITHRFSLDQFSQAIKTYEEDKERIKIIIKP